MTAVAIPAVRRGPRATLAVAIGVVGLVAVVAALGTTVAPFDPNAQDVLARLRPPSAAHWLGTDSLGRDTVSRLLAAARTDLVVGVLGAALPGLLGGVLGAVAGQRGGWLDAAVMRLCDLVMAFPVYVLIITLVALLGPGTRSILIAFTVVGWVPYARLIRDGVRRVRTEDYIAAAHLGGLSATRVLGRHILPNVTRPLIAYLVLDVMIVILTVAAFSYLGLGIQPPTPEWGAMIADAQPYLRTHWWLTAVPGAAIAVVGLGFLLLGEVVEDRGRGTS